jgi:hypothetical protein
MNSLGIAFFVFTAVALSTLPRQWAALPLLVGACYITFGQVVQVGPFHFTLIRMLVTVGVVRVFLRGERVAGRFNDLDKLMLVWGVWALLSSAFHDDPSAALIFRLGLCFDAFGIYFLLRIFCQSLDDVVRLCRITAILLAPVAIEMLAEKTLAHNFFSVFGGVPNTPEIREGAIRAQGPFAHAILAGTVGAVCLPLMIALWRHHRKQALIGIASCFGMIFSSGSSGPILSASAAIAALSLWPWRHRMRLFRWLMVLGYFLLALAMKAPPYYLMSRIDLVGGSTGWHRARLIQSAFEHLNEWWFAGTDYTRNWMPTGVLWSQEQTDITNHYLHMGVLGGLPLMLLFILILAKGFSFVGETWRQADNRTALTGFMIWAFGASLFAHASTFISVSYFDQSFVFLYLTLAVIASVRSITILQATEELPQEQPVHAGIYPLDAEP